MIENYKSSNGFTAPHPKETVTTAPAFDLTARRTARMVVPLTPAAIEDALSEITQVKVAHTHKPVSHAVNKQIVSESKTILYLKYAFTAALTVFVLGAGAVGGFALAEYRNLQEKQGFTLISQPTLKVAVKSSGLAPQAFDYSDVFAKAEEEAMIDDMDDDAYDDTLIVDSQDDSQTEPKPSRIPNKRQKQDEQEEQVEPSDDEQQSPPQEKRERRVRQPKPEDNSNNNSNRQKHTQTQNAKESVLQKLKRAIEKLGQN